jgi:hypothetical protein
MGTQDAYEIPLEVSLPHASCPLAVPTFERPRLSPAAIEH